MKQWALLCVERVQRLPPHSVQLETAISIHPAKEVPYMSIRLVNTLEIVATEALNSITEADSEDGDELQQIVKTGFQNPHLAMVLEKKNQALTI